MVAGTRHGISAEEDGCDVKEDEGEKSDRRLSSRVAVNKEKIQRDIVHGNEQTSSATRNGDVQDYHLGIGQEVAGEQSVDLVGEDGVVLRDGECSNEDDEEHDASDEPTIIPCPLRTAEGEGQDEADIDARVEGNSQPVELLELLDEGCVGLLGQRR